jgi:hypothetical protein
MLLLVSALMPVCSRIFDAQVVASDDAIRPLVEKFVVHGYTNPEIISCLREHNFNVLYVATSKSCVQENLLT